MKCEGIEGGKWIGRHVMGERGHLGIETGASSLWAERMLSVGLKRWRYILDIRLASFPPWLRQCIIKNIRYPLRSPSSSLTLNLSIQRPHTTHSETPTANTTHP